MLRFLQLIILCMLFNFESVHASGGCRDALSKDPEDGLRVFETEMAREFADMVADQILEFTRESGDKTSRS